MSNEASIIFQLIKDSEGKLVGLVGDKLTHTDCPVGFAPSEDLVLAVKLVLLQEANSSRHDAIYFQLALEELETAWTKLHKILDDE